MYILLVNNNSNSKYEKKIKFMPSSNVVRKAIDFVINESDGEFSAR